MDKNKIVIGNLKMNLNCSEAKTYVNEIADKIHSDHVIICPSTLYLPYFMDHSFKVGIQNVAPYENGAYTGEVSALQASSMGVIMTLVGHSERRMMFHETDEEIANKVKEAMKHSLKVVLCIGETKEEKDMLKTSSVLKRQLVSVLRGLEKEMYPHIMIAYEPVWAIGTGVIPSNHEIEKTLSYIKEIVLSFEKDCKVPVLYGGSINDKNIETLVTIPNVDGFLVGGASLKIEKFLRIIKVVFGE